MLHVGSSWASGKSLAWKLLPMPTTSTLSDVVNLNGGIVVVLLDSLWRFSGWKLYSGLVYRWWWCSFDVAFLHELSSLKPPNVWSFCRLEWFPSSPLWVGCFASSFWSFWVFLLSSFGCGFRLICARFVLVLCASCLCVVPTSFYVVHHSSTVEQVFGHLGVCQLFLWRALTFVFLQIYSFLIKKRSKKSTITFILHRLHVPIILIERYCSSQKQEQSQLKGTYKFILQIKIVVNSLMM